MDNVCSENKTSLRADQAASCAINITASFWAKNLLLCLFFFLAKSLVFAQVDTLSNPVDSTEIQVGLDSVPKATLGKGRGRAVEILSDSEKEKKNTQKELREKVVKELEEQKEKEGSEEKAEATKRKRSLTKLFNRDVKKAPLKAVLLSAVLPGAGQAFNRRYWKIPIVAAGLGVTGTFIVGNTRLYKKYSRAYLYRVDGDSTTTADASLFNYSDSNLKAIRNTYKKNVELSYIAFFGVYFLTGVDAFVDAHLYTFDISEDLSMRVAPKLWLDARKLSPVMGLGISFLPNHKKEIPKNLF